MADKDFVTNIPKGSIFQFKNLLGYEEGSIVSKTIVKESGVNITLFSFDKGEEVSTHSAPGDALVQLLEGEAIITIDGTSSTLNEGDSILMPHDIPHGVQASKKMKMLLTIIK